MSKLCDIFAPANRERCVKLLSKIKPLRPKPVKSFDSAVLIPLCYYDNKPAILYTKRSMSLRLHAGEVSFPGGKVDANETPVQAALRELQEEVGIPSDCVDIWGTFCPCPTRSTVSFITPVVGFCGYFRSSPSSQDVIHTTSLDANSTSIRLQVNTYEVECLIFRSLDWLSQPKNLQHVYFCSSPAAPFIGATSYESHLLQTPLVAHSPVDNFRFVMPVFGGPPDGNTDWPRIWGLTALLSHQILLCLLPHGLPWHDPLPNMFQPHF